MDDGFGTTQGFWKQEFQEVQTIGKTTIYKNMDVPQQGSLGNPQECVGEMTSFKGNGTRMASSTNRGTGPKPLSQKGGDARENLDTTSSQFLQCY